MELTVPLFRTPTLRPWLASRFLSSLARQTQNLVIAWQIYDITHSPLALGCVGLAEALPYLLVALWAGHAADRYEKKRLICVSKIGLVLCAAGLLALSNFVAGDTTAVSVMWRVLPIYGILGLSAITASLELPASSSYIQMLIAKEQFSRVAAWNFAQFQIATIAGPILGGWLLDFGGAATAYRIVLLLFMGSALLATCLKKMEVSPQASAGVDVPRSSPGSWESIQIGLQFLLENKFIFACMSVDMWAVLFGDVVAILPVFAEKFGVGAIGLGLLRAAPAIGGCITSLLEVWRPMLRVSWNNLLWAVALFCISIIGFALSQHLVWALFFLTLSGLADGASVIIRQSVYQANTPDHLRGRVASVSGMFIRVSNELGGFESGMAAYLLGPVRSVLFGGTMSLLVALFMWFKYRHYGFTPLVDTDQLSDPTTNSGK